MLRKGNEPGMARYSARDAEEMSPYYYVLIGVVVAAAIIYLIRGREARREHEE